MMEEPFALGDSILHRIDPRFRIVMAVLFSIVVAVSYHFPTLILALLATIVLTLSARLNLKAVAGRLLVLAGFLLLLWLVLPITLGGVSVAGFPGASRDGIVLAAQISIKSIALTLGFIALVTTMNFAALGHALGRLRLPGKIVHLMLMTYRYIAVIALEYERLLRAAKIRGFRPGTNLHTYKTYAYFIAMLFIRAASRAERVNRAMRCRGFDGRFFCLSDFPPDPRNWVFAVSMAAVILVLALIEWGEIFGISFMRA
jgi:cobalt/nickel transport system permease protein